MLENIPVLSLAFVGDSVFDLYVRSKLAQNPAKVETLHKKAVAHVNATAQSKFFEQIKDKLKEKELAIFNRGKNAKSTPPRNANPKDYAIATGFEALLGHLYLCNQHERIEELLCKIKFCQ